MPKDYSSLFLRSQETEHLGTHICHAVSNHVKCHSSLDVAASGEDSLSLELVDILFGQVLVASCHHRGLI